MNDDIGIAGPAPGWLGEPTLQPGERVLVWGGPRDGRLKGWLRGQVGCLLAKKQVGIVMIACFAAVGTFPFAGMGLDKLLGWADSGAAFFIGLFLSVGCVFGTIGALIWAEKDVFHVLTDRRLLVIKGYELVQAFDLEVMRRLLAAADAAKDAAPGRPLDQHVVEPGKVRPLLAPRSAGVTEIDPILRMLRAFGQVQAPLSK